jgi:outer membrane protein assembly factor BamB
MTTEQRRRWRPEIPLAVARWAGRVLIVAAVLAVLWPPSVEWGGRRWSWPVAGAIGLGMIAAAALLNAALQRSPRRRVRPVSAVVGVGATVAGVVVAALVVRAAGLPVTADSVSGTVMLALLVPAALVVAWLLVAISAGAEEPDRPSTEGDMVVAGGAASGPLSPSYHTAFGSSRLQTVVVTAVLVTLGTLFVAGWSSAHRDTARPLGGLVPQPPRDVSRDRWSATVGGPVLSAGRYFVVDLDGGVEVRDALTGQRRWHYRRTDDTFSRAAVSADGRTVMVIWPDREQPAGAAFDLATGVQRWARNLPTQSPVSDGSLPTGAVSAGRVVVLFAGRSRSTTTDHGFALDTVTGSVRWQVPDPPQPACEYMDAVAAMDTVAVAYRCGNRLAGKEDWQVVALSASDGRVRWTRQSPAMSFLSLYGHGARVFQVGWPTDTCETVILDAATGDEQARHAHPSAGCSTPIVGDGVVGYVGQPQGSAGLLTGVDQQTGQLRWTVTLPDQLTKAVVVATAVSGSTAYLLYGASLGATDGDLVVLDLVTGAVNIHRNRLTGTPQPAVRPPTMLLGPGRLILVRVMTRDPNDDRHAVTALG